MLSVRFWGVRGSIPTPGPGTVKYGGNTSCLEIRADERLIIIDLGSGVRPLGEWLLANDYKKNKKIEADILLTHTHWDHIMGFPMFSLVYTPNIKLRIYGPVSMDNISLKSIVENQLSHQYWPVKASELAAKIEYFEINETTIDLGDGINVTSKFLNHPIFCLGYRVNFRGKSIATVYDHEFFSNLFQGDKTAEIEGEAAAAEENEKIRQFVKGADILIHDAQFSMEGYTSHKGWGHCAFEHAVQSAADNDVKTLVLFHHEPDHTDDQLEEIEKNYADKSNPRIIIAKEGLFLTCDE